MSREKYSMRLKTLSTTGVSIPEVGLGTWNYHAGPGPLRKGLEAGALFIDTAESYGTERVVRDAIAGMRDSVFIATKVSPENFHDTALRKSVDSSLFKLGVEVIDLLQLHEPNRSIPIEETMGAMAELVDAGKVRFIGVSNFSVLQLQEAQKALSRFRIVSNQVRFSLVDRTIEKDLLQHCQKERVAVIAYSPLARQFDRIRDCDPLKIIDKLARTLGKSPAQIALNWCLCRDGVVVIPKGNSVEHIIDNCGASDWRLDEEQLQLLDQNIKYRQRSTFDVWIRRAMPSGMSKLAVQAANYLPRSLRRRIQ